MVHLLLAFLFSHTGSMQHSNICLQFPVTGTCILNIDPAGDSNPRPLGCEHDTLTTKLPEAGIKVWYIHIVPAYLSVQGYCSDNPACSPNPPRTYW